MYSLKEEILMTLREKAKILDKTAINRIIMRMSHEILERNSEKIAILGPVVERFQSEVLNNIIESLYELVAANNMFPPAPDEIGGMEIKIKYISILSQAQKKYGLSAIQQTAMFMGQLAQMNPNVLTLLNFEAAVREFAETIGCPPDVMNDKETARKLLEAQQQAAQQQQMIQSIPAQTQAAKTMSETPVSEGKTMLDVIQQSINSPGGVQNAL